MSKKTSNEILVGMMEIMVKEYGLKTLYGEVHRLKGNVYEPFEGGRLQKLIIEQFNLAGQRSLLSKYGVENIVYLLRGFSSVPEDEVNPEKCFCTPNGILKINEDGKVGLSQDDDLIFTASGEVPYLHDCDSAAAENFLELIVPNERERKLLLESCAVAMFPFIRHLVNYDHFSVCFGTGANGKSVFFESILTPIFGEKTIANVTVEELKQRFNLHNLLGCRLNISTENEESYLREHKQLKALTSGDRQLIERKHEQPFFSRIFIVPFFCINQQPQIGNVSYAMKRRLIIINFPNRFSDKAKDPKFKADPELKNSASPKCQAIQQGVFKLIVETVERLLGEKTLTSVDLSRIEELQKESSHLRLFVDDYYVFDENVSIQASELFEAYKEYCSVKGYYIDQFERWNDPSKYDPAIKHSGALTGKLVRFFPDQLFHGKDKGSRCLKGLREKTDLEKAQAMGSEYTPTYIEKKLGQLKSEDKKGYQGRVSR